MTDNLNYIKYRDAEDIKAFYYSLTYKERVAFVKEFVEKSGLEKHYFFNWKGTSSRILPGMKKILEDVAGQRIFTSDDQE